MTLSRIPTKSPQISPPPLTQDEELKYLVTPEGYDSEVDNPVTNQPGRGQPGQLGQLGRLPTSHGLIGAATGAFSAAALVGFFWAAQRRQQIRRERPRVGTLNSVTSSASGAAGESA